MQEYSLLNIDKLNSVLESLEFIIANDKNLFFKLFQNKNLKQKVEMTKLTIGKDIGLIEDLESKICEWDNLVEREVSGEQIQKAISLYQVYTRNRFSEEFPLMMFCNKRLYLMYKSMYRFTKNHLVEQIELLWSKMAEERVEKELSLLPIHMFAPMLATKLQNKLEKNYITIGKLDKALDERGGGEVTITEKEISQINIAKQELRKKLLDNAYPRLNADNLYEHEYQLIELLYQHMAYPDSLDHLNNEILVGIKQWGKSYTEWNLLAPSRQEADVKLQHLFGEWAGKEQQLYQKFVEIRENISRIRSYQFEVLSREVLRQHFITNASSYYSLIEKLIGKKRVYQPNDLPSLIVDEVSKIKINTKDLKVTTRAYQEFGAQFVLYQKNVLLGDEMGLGKTIQAITVANHLYQEGQNHTIIICPFSVLENWKREIEKWSNLNVYRFCSANSSRYDDLDRWMQVGGCLIANYEQAQKIRAVIPKYKIDLIVVDEAHYIKSPWTKRTINTTQLAQNSSYKLFMTGTPLENRLSEMQHLIKVLNPKLNEKMFSEKPNVEEFKELSANIYLRRKREEVLNELPDLEMIESWSRFTTEQEKLYDDSVCDGTLNFMKLRRFAFLGEKSEKIEQIKEICRQARENGQKVLIFSYFKTDVLYKLHDCLEHVAPEILSGDISASHRQEVIDEFSESVDQTVLLSQIDAGGVGLNIQVANIVILCEPQWKPSTEQQAISRSYRMGQTRKVIVYRLLTKDSIDESMMLILHHKEELFQKYAEDSLIAASFAERENWSEKETKQQILSLERKRVTKKRIKSSSKATTITS